jgi:hypothetical protein
MEKGKQLEAIEGIEPNEGGGANLKYAVPLGDQIQPALPRRMTFDPTAAGSLGE